MSSYISTFTDLFL